jgi:hypothetical protein
MVSFSGYSPMRPKNIEPYIFYICCALMAAIVLLDSVKLNPSTSIIYIFVIVSLLSIHFIFKSFKHKLSTKVLAIAFSLKKIFDIAVIASCGAYLHHRWLTEGSTFLITIISIMIIMFGVLFITNYRKFIQEKPNNST